MSSHAANGQRLVLGAIAVVAMALTGVGLAIVNGEGSLTTRSAPDLRFAVRDSVRSPRERPTGMRPRSGSLEARDPFGVVPTARPASRSVVTAEAPAPRTPVWVVSSILFQGSGRLAIVNDAWVRIGDRVAGNARVTDIARKHVVVTDASGARHIVSLKD